MELANSPRRFNQQEVFQMAGCASPRVLEKLRHCDIDPRHFKVELGQRRGESPDDLSRPFLSDALDIGSRAIAACLEAAKASVADVDLLVICTPTGYVCPDLGSRLMERMGFRPGVQRGVMLSLDSAGTLPTLQRACDFVRAHPGCTALMLAAEICSACYFIAGLPAEAAPLKW